MTLRLIRQREVAEFVRRLNFEVDNAQLAPEMKTAEGAVEASFLNGDLLYIDPDNDRDFFWVHPVQQDAFVRWDGGDSSRRRARFKFIVDDMLARGLVTAHFNTGAKASDDAAEWTAASVTGRRASVDIAIAKLRL